MKTKFPAMMAGAALGALFILGAAVGPAAAWDYHDGGPRFGGGGEIHFDGHHHDWGGPGWGYPYRGPYGPRWYGPRWYGPPRYHGPSIELYVPPPVIYYPPYPAPLPPPSYSSAHVSRRSAMA
jgi:hypothetical protein